VAVGIGWLLLHLRTRRIQENFSNKLMEMELKALRGQMNPHFIFNSLNSIQYFILKKEPKEAYKYLSKFSGLMRKILQNSRERFISLSEEVETLELYLELEDLRMDGTLDYQIQVDESIDRDKWAIPTMLIQPFVENAIIHGLMPKDSDRKLTITIERSETGLITRIEDNGIGISASRENNRTRVKKHRSAGVDVTEERLKVLSTEKGEARLTIQEVMNGDEVIGTRVTLLTPKIIVE
jgi:sensor histidine kinase YesM